MAWLIKAWTPVPQPDRTLTAKLEKATTTKSDISKVQKGSVQTPVLSRSFYRSHSRLLLLNLSLHFNSITNSKTALHFEKHLTAPLIAFDFCSSPRKIFGSIPAPSPAHLRPSRSCSQTHYHSSYSAVPSQRQLC